MTKNILITGAAGTIGTTLLSLLIKQDGLNITAFDLKSKKSTKSLNNLKNRVKIIYGDISKKKEIIIACKNQDIVIHLAAIIPPLADDHPKLANDVNVEGTRNIIEALEEFSPNAFFIFSSSIAIYGDRIKNPDIKVTDQLSPSEGDEYALTKIKAEQLIQNSKLNWVIFRLTAIMGSKNHKVSKLMFHMPLNTPIEIATPEDTARALVNACDHRKELNHQIFNLGGGENCRILYKDLLSGSFRIFGLGKLDFPENAFAEKNFHCGNYDDGDNLEKIIHFRQDTINDYFHRLEQTNSPVKKTLAQLFRKPIQKWLLKQSEPLNALKKNNTALISRFFYTDK
ncbi:MAG: NAD(P)-dependent oxidoreductase [Bacteroidales bacterium]|nr:NAD(P)-dependent oxidoreductase [Bacteroidales bacterium]